MHSGEYWDENRISKQGRVRIANWPWINTNNFWWNIQSVAANLHQLEIQKSVYEKKSGRNGGIGEKWVLGIQVKRCSSLITNFKTRLNKESVIGS